MTTEPVEDKNMAEKHPHHAALYDLARRVMLAAAGATMLASDEIEEFVKKLVERGELAEQDARNLIREVLEKREKVATERKAEQERSQPAPVTRADIDMLNARLEELANKLDELSKSRHAHD